MRLDPVTVQLTVEEEVRLVWLDILELCVLGLDTLGQLGATTEIVTKHLHSSEEASSVL